MTAQLTTLGNHKAIAQNYTKLNFVPGGVIMHTEKLTDYEIKRQTSRAYPAETARRNWLHKVTGIETRDNSWYPLEQLERIYRNEYNRFLSPLESAADAKSQTAEKLVRIALYRAKIDNRVALLANDLISAYESSIESVARPVAALQENMLAALKALKNGYGNTPDQHMVRLHAVGSRLEMAATNGSTWLATSIGARSGMPLDIYVPARILTDLIQAMPPERVDMSMTSKRNTVTGKPEKVLHIEVCEGRGKANLVGTITPDKVQPMPELPDMTPATLAQPSKFKSELKRLVKMTADKKSGRQILMGVLLRFGENKITLAAADGVQLGTAELDAYTADLRGDYILASWDVKALLAIIDKSNNELELLGDGKHLFARDGEMTLCFTAIEGRFVDFAAITANSFDAEIGVELHQLISAVKSLKAFWNAEKFGAGVIKAEVIHEQRKYGDDTVLRLSAASQEKGDRSLDIPATWLTGSIERGPAYIDGKKFLPTLETIAAAQPVTYTLQKNGKRKAEKNTIIDTVIGMAARNPWKVSAHSRSAQNEPVEAILMPIQPGN